MKRPHISQRTLRGIMWALLAVAIVGGARSVWGGLPVHGAADTDPDGNIDVQLADAAKAVIPDGRVSRSYQAEGDGRFQVSVVDSRDRCWKVAVIVSGGSATADGDPALVGCWPTPDTTGKMTGEGDEPDADVRAAAYGFLGAYLTGGDVSRYAKPGLTFPLPTPLPKGSFALGDSHDVGAGWVVVNGWVDAPTDADSDRRVDTAWRVQTIDSPLGPVVSFVAAGPPPVEDGTTDTTQPPTTTTQPPTTTTSTTTSTTARPRGE